MNVRGTFRIRVCGWILVSPLLGVSTLVSNSASGSTASDLERRFVRRVRPFLETYCFDCHNKEKQKGKLDLTVYSTPERVAQDYRRWDILLEKLQTNEMPPDEARHHPPPELRKNVADWIQTFRTHQAERTAGDPGPVLARRLSNAEYDYTVRDLTRVDIRPTREFPVDPANEAGFDNSGESLAMSPTLLKKYLAAARRVANHIVLTPDGFTFAPHPMVTDPDRDKYSVKRIVDFYQRQPTHYADYFMAAWRFKNRFTLGETKALLADMAGKKQLSAKYLATIWSALEEGPDEAGPFAALRKRWRELAGADTNDAARVRLGCEQMSDFVVQLHQRLKTDVKNLGVPGIAAGSQPLVLWKDRELAANHQRYVPGTLHVQAAPRELDKATVSADVEQALAFPADDAARTSFEAALARFCRIFPDAFCVSERGLVFLTEDKESKGRLLSAGFHLMVGYFRDDAPLYELLLDPNQQRELDTLWQELDFITSAPMRQYKDFIFFERAEPPWFMQGAEFDFARSEDQDVTSEAKIRQLAEAYRIKARRNGGEGAAIAAIEDYFKNISAQVRWIEAARLAAEPSYLKSLLALAERAYRRPLSRAERDDLLSFYRELRSKDGLNCEEAIRDTVTSILMSPHFCYRVQPAPVKGVRSLSDHALASRLSYFLWSSMPDEALLARVEAGDLHRPKILLGQVRRMLHDERVRALATEFGGNWLDFRRFEEHNSVDRERFKTFNNELRQAMFEEPIQFFLDVLREDRGVLNFLYGDYTFVNPILAKHYGMPDSNAGPQQWRRVDDAHRYDRGGLLPMSVFLTLNSPGLRTSPVKRGYWIVRRLLGETIPPPPPSVPELPRDEATLGAETLRETLARHRQDKSCAGCHARFDSYGLVFENYGPIGERRLLDLGGHPVDTRALFPDGTEETGVDGLRDYLRKHRQEDFLENLCRKLLAYSLSRSLQLSDDSTIRDMRATLAAKDHRFSSLVESIVTSPQFLNQRSENPATKK
ncbi:MAG: DUF1592 domain-containing protein [Pedosphaera sp.]|nr:DUF1592 domain-containing protein [Pedosphaera sp.]